MNKRIKKIIITYFLFVLLFVLQKPLFMGYNHTLYKNCTLTDYLSVMFHGLPLDLSVAGYLTIIPAFLLIFSVWTNSKALYRIKQLYFGIISLLLSIIFIVNTGLYSFWEFPLDYSPLFYFFSSPKLAAASVSYGYVIIAILTIIIYATLLFTIFYLFLIRQKVLLKIPYYRIKESFILLVLTGVLFLPIRGGIGVSTMNIGKAFYSQDQFLNHAAVNPVFSLNASLAHQNNFDKQYQYFKPAIADSLFSQLVDKPVSDSIPQLLNTKRPNIIFVILESFSTYIMKTMDGLPNVAINMDKYAQEGVLFTHCYANSFRTDRGLAAILSAYPAQPNTSIMKYPEKTAHLPSLIRTLRDNGYQTEYYYGGDADFTNKRSFLLSSGIEKLISESDFPIKMHLNNKWGTPDGPLFNRAMEDLKKGKSKQPFLKIIQTLSSHEPFDVPFHRLNDKVLNAFAYTDSCLGNFIENYKRTKYWKNTLIILVPDHRGAYPEHADNELAKNHTIPLIFLGGSLKGPKQISTYASQIDIAATLLSQLGISHKEFKFSKNILNPSSPHFGYYAVPNTFGMVTPENTLVYNCVSNKIVTNTGPKKSENLNTGKAYLQEIYLDMGKR